MVYGAVEGTEPFHARAGRRYEEDLGFSPLEVLHELVLRVLIQEVDAHNVEIWASPVSAEYQ